VERTKSRLRLRQSFLHGLQKRRRRCLERSRDLGDVDERDVALSALDRAEVRPVEAGSRSEFLLRERALGRRSPTRLAGRPDGGARMPLNAVVS
jgi:hypothetical protein